MKAERKGQAIVVSLSAEETFSVQAGNVVSSRPGVTLPDAKINVWPLSAIKPDNSLKDKWAIDRFEKGLVAPLEGRLDRDGDLAIFVPAIKLSDVRISGGNIPREQVETPGTKDEDRERFLGHTIPEKGVIVVFGGSIKEIDVNNIYYKVEE